MKKYLFLITIFAVLSFNNLSAQEKTAKPTPAPTKTETKVDATPQAPEAGLPEAARIEAEQEAQAQQVAVNDSVIAILPLDSLQSYFNQLIRKVGGVDSTTTTGDLQALAGVTVKVVNEVAYIIKNAPKPNTQENVAWYTELAKMAWDNLYILITTLLTALWGLFKKNPKDAVGKVAKFFAKIKTRYVVVATSIVATIVGLTYFHDGAWSIPVAIFYIFSSIVGGIGLAEVLSWIGIKLQVKNPKPAA